RSEEALHDGEIGEEKLQKEDEGDGAKNIAIAGESFPVQYRGLQIACVQQVEDLEEDESVDRSSAGDLQGGAVKGIPEEEAECADYHDGRGESDAPDHEGGEEGLLRVPRGAAHDIRLGGLE